MTAGGTPDRDLGDVSKWLAWVEDEVLAPYAQHAFQSAGRVRPERPSPVRTPYQRDRDRIVHANSFRRLRGKTQVFIAPAGDHYATRLSHVIEVSQVARVIARALRLNEDLVEAIALAHDLGHAPFGHAGQDALDRLLGGGYRHDEQSVRVVVHLEKNGRGLNLTREVVDGIRTHRKPRHDLAGVAVAASMTLEAEVVKLADAIAYINHDIEDALRAHIIAVGDLPTSALDTLGATRSGRIDALVCDVVSYSLGLPRVAMSPDMLAVTNTLRDYLFDHVYTNPVVKQEADRARHVVSELYGWFCLHPDRMPETFQADPRSEGTERRVADYIAGMTDFYAIGIFQDLFVPKMWSI